MAEINFGAGQTRVVADPVKPQPPAAAPAATAPQQEVEVLPPEAQEVAQGREKALVPAGSNFETAVVPAEPPPKRTLGDRIPDVEDLILPTLNLVHNVGGLKDTFEPGQIVLGSNAVLYSPLKLDAKTGALIRPATPPVILTALGCGPSRFTERTGDGTRGLLLESEAAVAKHNGTLNYRDWEARKAQGVKLFHEMVTFLLLVECPASVSDPEHLAFPFELEGKFYTLALWNLKSTAFTEVCKKFLYVQRRGGFLAKGYHTVSFALTTRLEGARFTNPTWLPVVAAHKRSTPGFITAAEGILAAA